MKVLAIDTTTRRGSVALAEDGEVLGEVRFTAEGGHSERVIPALALLLDLHRLRAPDVEAYAVAVGPGSFTGLRVGISTVQGLALAGRRPCLGLSALDLLAARIQGAAPVLVAMIDAYRDDVFARAFDGDARPLGPPAVVRAPEFMAGLSPGPVAVLGDGALRYRPEIEAVHPQARFPRRSLYLAGTLAGLAAARLGAGEGVRAEELRPLYLREAQIRRAP